MPNGDQVLRSGEFVKRVKLRTRIFALVPVLLAGCVGLQTFPHVARSGDTITLALGSLEGATVSNTSAIFTSDAAPDASVDLSANIEAIFKLYPDKTSRVALVSDATRIPVNSGHQAWVTVMVINLPSGLPSGPGVVRVVTGGTSPVMTTAVEEVSVALEILPGIGQPNPLRYLHNQVLTGRLGDLEPVPNVELRAEYDPASQAVWPLIGAVEIKWQVPMQVEGGGAVLADDIRLVTQDSGVTSGSQLQTRWTRDGEAFHIALLSTTGIKPYETSLAIGLREGNRFSGEPDRYPEVRYYDMFGEPVSGPELSVWQDGVLLPGLP